MEPFEFKVDDITEQNNDILTEFYGKIAKARNEAVKRGIKANSIVINKNMVFVPGDYELYPTMVCGLDVYVTKDELPDGYSFAVVESQREKTNADRIRAMSDEDLKDSILAVHHGYAPWCDYHCENKGDDGCDRCIEKWLKQPAEVE
jgi:hypothetical protein